MKVRANIQCKILFASNVLPVKGNNPIPIKENDAIACKLYMDFLTLLYFGFVIASKPQSNPVAIAEILKYLPASKINA